MISYHIQSSRGMPSHSSETFSKIFVTVGTTDFDSLIDKLDSEEFLELIRVNACRQLIIQNGRGTRVPQYLPEACKRHGIAFESFRFKDSLEDCMKDATLVICHAGAGSISESLSLRKKVMVIVNESLMDNHQLELAEAVVERGFCYLAFPHNVVDSLRSADFDALVDYEPIDTQAFPALLDELLFSGS